MHDELKYFRRYRVCFNTFGEIDYRVGGKWQSRVEIGLLTLYCAYLPETTNRYLQFRVNFNIAYNLLLLLSKDE